MKGAIAAAGYASPCLISGRAAITSKTRLERVAAAGMRCSSDVGHSPSPGKLFINLKIASEGCYFCDLFVRMVVVHFKKVFATDRFLIHRNLGEEILFKGHVHSVPNIGNVYNSFSVIEFIR